ncbi:hypothetical protein EV127DRAFT_466492 [Xylaria flabelliformis]|nr:hypothetical protein EV127DRAFT_466492 [Xylaria flabelliformis]
MAIKRLVMITFLLSVAEGLLSREPIRDDKLGKPYMSNITWTGLIDKDSGQMSFTGLSLQQIHEQIREINPNFSWSRKIEPESQDSWDEDRGNILCDMAWNPKFASVFHIRQGIAYLHKIHGNCTNGPGPGNCARVSCSYGSGIWFCNDNSHPTSVPCSTFGDRAWDIIEKCYAFGNFPTDSVHGQAFDTAGWNVIVAGTDC